MRAYGTDFSCGQHGPKLIFRMFLLFLTERMQGGQGHTYRVDAHIALGQVTLQWRCVCSVAPAAMVKLLGVCVTIGRYLANFAFGSLDSSHLAERNAVLIPRGGHPSI